MATATAADEWDKAAQAVRGAAEELRGADTAALRTWAQTNKLLSRSMWPKVKRELYKQLDIDYDTQRETETEARQQAVAAAAAAAPLVELYAAGDERGSFAVLPGPAVNHGSDADVNDAAWYGTFHEKDTIYRAGDQDSADNSAAGKAVFLAGKVREEQGLDAVRLLLHISNRTSTETGWPAPRRRPGSLSNSTSPTPTLRASTANAPVTRRGRRSG
ncbi:hypothetical protein Rhow_004589 [Rhodococcus wratislaviensis]|uniref:Uncharacterized protein n=1 Tax=Rhodococcus wratislaviensis TaxID=44752 RepID=A0A402CBG8_RHOWR|nr:hypothetical protein [Rhodococcus wratislaviensis]GCE40946.1 hypothetical protein Rhow_004589 [Rhodococcus wratislaviensis]